MNGIASEYTHKHTHTRSARAARYVPPFCSPPTGAGFLDFSPSDGWILRVILRGGRNELSAMIRKRLHVEEGGGYLASRNAVKARMRGGETEDFCTPLVPLENLSGKRGLAVRAGATDEWVL